MISIFIKPCAVSILPLFKRKYTVLLLPFLLHQCKPAPPRMVERAFYHWQSVFDLSAYEQRKLDSLRINRLYVKYFDVDWNANQQQAQPLAYLQVKQPSWFQKHTYNIVPTVFITNTCLQQLPVQQVIPLADNILRLRYWQRGK